MVSHMRCPYCGSENLKVVDSRSADDAAIRRRRQCEECDKRFTTYEKIETLPIMVIKKDGTREAFDRDKLIDRVMRSTYKRHVSSEQIQKIADDVENAAMSAYNREIQSREIGELVMEGLKAVDEVSYVRFASIYREFKDVNSFMQEIRALMEQNHNKE